MTRKRKLLLLLAYYHLKKNKMMQEKSVRSRRWSVRPLNKNRNNEGEYKRLFLEMKMCDAEWFFTYTRMSSTCFEDLLNLTGPLLTKRSCETTILPGQRLAITLRFLSQGDSTFSIACSYRLGKCTVRKVIWETLSVIWTVLIPKVLPQLTETDYNLFANQFQEKWQMPHCVGAIDGKHIQIQAPQKSGSLYFNYNKYFSIVLFGVCDANYNFIIVDIGSYGSQSDGAILASSDFGHALTNKLIPLPAAKELPNSNTLRSEYFFIGDEAFPLQKNLMRPYSKASIKNNVVKKCFNVRLSRARKCIENTFGILTARWRIFLRSISANPENVDLIIKASVCLHNYIKKNVYAVRNRYCPSNYADFEDMPGVWRNEIEGCVFNKIGKLSSNHSTVSAQSQRDRIAEYFCTEEGYMPGQMEQVKRI